MKGFDDKGGDRTNTVLLNAITRVQSMFIANTDTHTLFEELLSNILSLTESEYGFICEVHYRQNGDPYMKTRALTNIAWNDETRALYEKYSSAGMEFTNIKSLFGAVITTGKAVISNNPSTDPRRCGIPEGHPSLDSFLGLPLYNGETMVGMIGLANRPGGYELDLVEYLQPLLSTCAHIIEGYRIDRKRKEAEEALMESERKYRNLFEDSRDTVFITTPEGRIIDVNQAGVALFGYSSRDELRSVNATELYCKPSQREKFINEIENRDFVKDFEIEVRSKDGEILNVSITATAERDKDGAITTIHGIIHDMTGHKRLEQQLMHAQKMEAIGQLTGGIAHDFNNILTGIIGYANLLNMKCKTDTSVSEYCNHIMNISERAAKLTQGLLTFSRKQVVNLNPVNLNQIIKNIENLLLRIIREDIELVIDLANDNLVIMADSGQIEQVIMNLAANANDAVQDTGRLTISTEFVKFDDDIVIKTSGYGEPVFFACLSISDTGIGMDEETRKRIFEPFFTTKEVGKGTGLGLAIVYGIVNSHKGSINVYSKPGIGTTFKIYFPLINTEAWADTSPAPQLHLHGNETILLTEDDTDVTIVTRTILEEFGYTVITACDGEEAVHRFREGKDRIKLVIMDVIMPKKNGREAYNEIREISPDATFIFTSGYTEDIISNRMIFEEGLNFISKPLTSRVLLKMVREVLDNNIYPPGAVN